MFIQYSGRPSLFLPACIFIWGGISAATGAVKSFAPAVVVSGPPRPRILPFCY